MQQKNLWQILKVGENAHKKRLDIFLEEKTGLTRSQVKKLIEKGFVLVNERKAEKAGIKLKKTDIIKYYIPPPEPSELIPKEEDLEILYEDEYIAAINKPAGVAIHPGAGHKQDTLANILIAKFPRLPTVGGKERPGIVHRLDKDTSGVLLVAKTEEVHRILSQMIKEKKLIKIYLAVCYGAPVQKEGVIKLPIARHPVDRKKMHVREGGREAITFYSIIDRKEKFSLIGARIITGRTHQIRVHFHHLRFPIVGDKVYGKKELHLIQRQALHALFLGFDHPITKERIEIYAPIPQDIKNLITKLELQLNNLESVIHQLSSKPIY